MEPTYTYDVFLSHNQADKDWTERLAIAIEADKSGRPLRVFFDRWDIALGGDIPAELEKGLQASRYVGLVLSPESLASNWVSLERSTALYRDPAARSQHIIPLLRHDCQIPPMLARLKYLDFRREQDFNASLTELIDTLRGRARPRGRDVDPNEVYFREDAALLLKHRTIFERSAFNTPCIYELFLSELHEAIDDTSAALNTGSLYTRSHNLVASFPGKNAYRLPEFRSAFTRISSTLTQLKRAVVEFEDYFVRVNPKYQHHKNFYAMLNGFWYDPSRGWWDAESRPPDAPTVDADMIRQLVSYMDKIDSLRNIMLGELNALLIKCGETQFDLIELSSAILKQGVGGDQIVAALNEI